MRRNFDVRMNVTLVSDVVSFVHPLVPMSRGGRFRHASSIEQVPQERLGRDLFLLLMQFDDDEGVAVRRILQAGGRIAKATNNEPHWYVTRQEALGEKSPTSGTRFVLQSWAARAAVVLSRQLSETGVTGPFYLDRHEAVCEVLEMTRNVPGAYVEVGVYRGASAAVALMYLRAAKIRRQVLLLDTFHGFAYDSAHRSGELGWAGTHVLFKSPGEWIAYLRDKLGQLAMPFEIRQLEIVNEELPEYLQQIAVAHIDVDMFEPTLAALQKVAPRMQPGGVIVLDDVDHLYGAYAALQEFLGLPAGKRFVRVASRAQILLVCVT